jgi:hypothetical protein
MPRPYTAFQYLYPPRPDLVLSSDRLGYYEKEGWVAQYKKNGTCTIVAMGPDGKGGVQFIAMNRHKGDHKAWNLTPEIKSDLLKLLPHHYWTVLVGEIMHSKTKTIKNTIFFHDILVMNNEYLLDTTFAQRQVWLEKLLPGNAESYSHFQVTNGIWRAKNFEKGFEKLFQGIKNQDIDEGLVLKKPGVKLKLCDTETSNSTWQAKVRYPKKNYSF